MKRILPLWLIFALCAPLWAAAAPDEIPADPALAARARTLNAGLRCMTCQGQSIAESDAPLARDMRMLVRDRLMAGESDTAIKAYLVGRYGDYILMRPPLQGRTILLWLAPFLMLSFAGAAFWRYARRTGGGTGEDGR